ncbi:hypothetical protein ONZ45_g3771 [Pleurotus djamor]|nr:hypothetical protein ONZ45_g3771 [Pleurotus djamor]
MDPLSIAGTVFSFVDIAKQIKASVGKVAKTRRSMRTTSDDILADLNALHNFCETHKLALEDAVELKDSLDGLKSQLMHVSTRCNRVFEPPSPTVLGRVKHALRTWKNGDSIESDVKRLKESVKASMSRIQLYVSARSEMAVVQTSQNMVILRSDLRTHMTRVDALFGKKIIEPGPNDFANILGHSEPNTVDQQYLRFKLQSIVDILESTTWSITAINPGTCRTINNRYIRVNTPKEHMSIMVSTLAPAWRIIDTLNTSSLSPFLSNCLDPLVDLACDVMYRGLDHIVFRIFDFAARMLKQLLRSHDSDQLLFYLSWVLVQQQYICPPGAKQVALTQENVAVRRKLLRSPKTTFPRSLRLYWLHHSIFRLAYACYCNEDADQAIYHYQESLQLTDTAHPDDYEEYIPISCKLEGQYSFVFQSAQTFVQDFALAQSTAYGLSLYAGSLRVLGRYREAYYAGRDAMTILQTLDASKDSLPPDFNLLGHRVRWIQVHLPSWVDIVRNPDVEENPDSTSGSTQQVAQNTNLTNTNTLAQTVPT